MLTHTAHRTVRSDTGLAGAPHLEVCGPERPVAIWGMVTYQCGCFRLVVRRLGPLTERCVPWFVARTPTLPLLRSPRAQNDVNRGREWTPALWRPAPTVVVPVASCPRGLPPLRSVPV